MGAAGEVKRSPVIAVTSASEPSITLDLEEAAHSMIVRACHNHDLLGLPSTSKTRRFEDLFYEDVIGVWLIRPVAVGLRNVLTAAARRVSDRSRVRAHILGLASKPGTSILASWSQGIRPMAVAAMRASLWTRRPPA